MSYASTLNFCNQKQTYKERQSSLDKEGTKYKVKSEGGMLFYWKTTSIIQDY